MEYVADSVSSTCSVQLVCTFIFSHFSDLVCILIVELLTVLYVLLHILTRTPLKRFSNLFPGQIKIFL